MKKKMYRILALLLIGVCIAGCGTKEESSDDAAKPETETETESPSGTPHVIIDVKDYGVIELDLDAETAPITVANFVKLVKQGFYDGLTFHRVMSGFMIQGGDPDGNGRGGSGEKIKGEFQSNGVENSIGHKRGVISMARSSLPDSASSQFFIMHQDSTYLDGEYAAFGHVTSGIEVVDQICEQVNVEDDNGTVVPANQPVINSIRIEE